MSQYTKWPVVSGGGGGSGTVTSVALTAPNIFNVSGSPVTTSGTLAITLANETANRVFAGPSSGGATTPTFRALVAADLPTGNLTDAGTDGIVVTGGTGAVIGSGTSLAQHVADTTHNGYLSSTDWNTFNSKQSALTLGNLTDAGTDGITVTGGSGAVVGSGTSLAQHVADTTHNGYLSSTDWNTFNSKQATITIGSFNGTSTANGLDITSNAISLHAADATNPGAVSTATQVFAGNKVVLGTFGASAISGFIPATAIECATNGAASTITATSYVTNSTSGGRHVGQHARGTYASPSALSSGDHIASFAAMGYGATAFPVAATGLMKFFATENFSDTAMGTKITFSTTPNGSITPGVALTLDQDLSATFGDGVTANKYTSTVATGTAPFVVASTTLVANLNVALATNVTGTVATANGGTGLTNGDVLISSFGVTTDGGGSVPATGSLGYVTIPYPGTINTWYLAANASGSCVIDVKRSGTSIVGGGGNKPTLSSAQSGNANASGWTSTTVSAGDIIEFNLDSITTITRVNLVIKITKT